jgi:hypothetical protein
MSSFFLVATEITGFAFGLCRNDRPVDLLELRIAVGMV